MSSHGRAGGAARWRLGSQAEAVSGRIGGWARDGAKEAGEVAGVLLITGGSRGIGAATARLAAGEGYQVAVNYRTAREAAEAVVAEIETAGGRAAAFQGRRGAVGALEQHYHHPTCRRPCRR